MNPEVFITYSKSGVAYLKDTTVTTGLTWGMKPDSPYKSFESILFSMGPVLSQPGKGTLVNSTWEARAGLTPSSRVHYELQCQTRQGITAKHLQSGPN